MATEPTISFRPLAREDFAQLHRWVRAPHVAPWWDDPVELDAITRDYAPCIAGEDRTQVFVVVVDGRAVGFLQSYRWADHPDLASTFGAGAGEAGIDIVIGEAEMTGRGLGPAIIRQFIETMVFADDAVRGVVVEPDARNARSVRAFEKAGFAAVTRIGLVGEAADRQVLRLVRG